jgi:putative transposase
MEKEEFRIKELSQTLEVSRSAYYAQRSKEKGLRRSQDANLTARIESIFGESRRTYGTRRVPVVLNREGESCSRRRISRLMKTQGLCALRKGRFRPRTTDSRHHQLISPNLLLPQADRPLPAAEQTWVADITYLPTGEGWHYLAAELKLDSRRVLGWKTSPNLESTLVEAAFSRALFGSASTPKVHHSDRGSQYAAGSFRSLLNSYGVTQSMSRRANCYDNAAMESFWATLKTECFHAGIPATRAEADALLFDYIETFYNPCTLHSALDYTSPLEYENSLKSINFQKPINNPLN